eukprot:364686-Chlamydomonas_euryale.AAC.15
MQLVKPGPGRAGAGACTGLKARFCVSCLLIWDVLVRRDRLRKQLLAKQQIAAHSQRIGSAYLIVSAQAGAEAEQSSST